MNRAAYILVLILIIILTFILGVRYGQRVEKTNKKIDYLLSIAPTKPAPTENPLEFKTYKNKFCGIEFLYPISFKPTEETTPAAKFQKLKNTELQFSCEATNSPKLKHKKLNPLNGKTTYYEASPQLLPLFESSLKFILK